MATLLSSINSGRYRLQSPQLCYLRNSSALLYTSVLGQVRDSLRDPQQRLVLLLLQTLPPLLNHSASPLSANTQLVRCRILVTALIINSIDLTYIGLGQPTGKVLLVGLAGLGKAQNSVLGALGQSGPDKPQPNPSSSGPALIPNNLPEITGGKDPNTWWGHAESIVITVFN